MSDFDKLYAQIPAGATTAKWTIQGVPATKAAIEFFTKKFPKVKTDVSESWADEDEFFITFTEFKK